MSKQDKTEREGIFIRGLVDGRSRQFFENINKYRYNYIFVCNGIRIIVSVWGDHTFLPLGLVAEVQVYAKAYIDKKGQMHINYEIPGDKNLAGEEF